MQSILGKPIVGFLLLAMAGSLLWYGVSANRIAAKDVEFWRKHPSVRMFPEVLVMEGNLSYFVDLDVVKASELYREAIAKQPLMIDAWLALARAELARGNAEEAHRILDTLAPLIAHVSTWKWQELLLSYDLKDEKRFADSYNFILLRLPNRIKEACYLAVKFWKGWGSILPHLTSESQLAFLIQLMQVREVDVALALWETMLQGRDTPDRDFKVRFCQFLLDNNRLEQAEKIWAAVRGDGLSAVYDGGFEQKPLNTAMGWRFNRHPEVSVERSLEAPYDGSFCLHLHFFGRANVSFDHVSQIIPVEPSRTYALTFARKSRNLTTDQGVFIQVSGYGCKGLQVTSEPLNGSSPWKEEELTVPVPDGCRAVMVKVRRRESLMFDNKIAGDYWLDALELK